MNYRTALLISFMTLGLINNAQAFDISQADTLLIAQRVFKNECAVEEKCLLEWNTGEDFLSLGLEHFTWYPSDSPDNPNEAFDRYLQYAKDRGEHLPDWLDKNPFPVCPWRSRDEFINSKDSRQYKDLMDFMVRTKNCQANYLIENTKRSLQKIIDVLPDDQRPHIDKLISQLSSNPKGLYAMIDYLDFKGPGIGQRGDLEDEGWGLLQVLQRMHDMPTTQEALEEFVRSAKIVLTHRVFIARQSKHEDQWLQGWLRRVDRYLVQEN
jgi:hypothetical protein